METPTRTRDRLLPTLAEAVIQDIRFGARALLRTPVLSVAVVLTLALGIGANTAIFSLLDTVVLRRLPVHEPEQLVVLGERQSMTMITADGDWQRDGSFYSVPLAKDLQQQTEVFSKVAAVSSFPVYIYLDPDQTSSTSNRQIVEARLVSGSFFQTLGVTAALGRTLNEQDDQVPGAHPVAVVSHAYWVSRLGRGADVIGQTLHLNGLAYTIVGVAPPGFFGVTVGTDTDIWAPLAMQAELMQEPSHLDDRDTMWLRIIGRRQPDVTAALAAERTNSLLRRLFLDEVGAESASATVAEIGKFSTELVPFARGFSDLRRQYAKPLVILMTVVGLVLLITCANIGNLLLARAATRRPEIAMRVTLGAGRSRLLRQLMTESLLLALLGAAVGLLVAEWAIRFLLGMIADGSLPVDLDPRVLVFTLVVSLLAALLFGLAPAFRSCRVDLHTVLRNQTVLAGEPRHGWSLRKALVVGQVAVSLPLLVASGLFLRSLDNLRSQDLGFSIEQVLQLGIDPQGGSYTREQLPDLYRDVRESLEALPEASSASLSLYGLLDGSRRVTEAHVDGILKASPQDRQIQVSFVTPGFFETAGATLLAGRSLDRHDRQDAPRVAVVNEAFARAFLGDSGAGTIGRRFGTDGEDSSRDIEIVGLVRNLKSHGLWGQVPRLVYLPVAQNMGYLNALQIRTRHDPAAIAHQVRQVLDRVAPDLPIYRMRTLREEIEQSLQQEKMLGELTTVFGLLALLLAAIGLYGVLAYGVSQRTREIGIRLALGAERGRVSWLVLRSALVWVTIGIAIGLTAALAAGRLIANLLFELPPSDLATILLATVTLLLIAALASFWPAHRASRLDPVSALRHE